MTTGHLTAAASWGARAVWALGIAGWIGVLVALFVAALVVLVFAVLIMTSEGGLAAASYALGALACLLVAAPLGVVHGWDAVNRRDAGRFAVVAAIELACLVALALAVNGSGVSFD